MNMWNKHPTGWMPVTFKAVMAINDKGSFPARKLLRKHDNQMQYMILSWNLDNEANTLWNIGQILNRAYRLNDR